MLKGNLLVKLKIYTERNIYIYILRGSNLKKKIRTLGFCKFFTENSHFQAFFYDDTLLLRILFSSQERERLKEQKRLEKTLIRQRKLEQKRYERLISRELKKPIDDMALKDLKALPCLPPVANLNIPSQAYSDLLMVEEFIHSFGHVIDIGKS